MFLTSEEDHLLSFCVLDLFFLDMNGKQVFPNANIRVQLFKTSMAGYLLWQKNSSGRWEKLKRQSDELNNSQQFVGVMGRDNIGNWLNIGKRRVGKKCFVKLRVFRDYNFRNEIEAEKMGLFTPKFFLKVGNEEPYQRFNIDFLPGNDSPGRHCYEVRYSKDELIFGEISLEVIDILGDKIGNPLPAIPVHLAYGELPDILRNKLAILHYTVTGERTYIRLNFEADRDGPFYKNKETCEASTAETKTAFGLDQGTQSCLMVILGISKRYAL